MKVLLLTQDHCASCEDARRLLERLAPEYGLELATLEFGSLEGQELAMRGGLMFPPGIVVDGEAVAYGRPSESRLRRELERRAARGTAR